jgi:hypothetical protein
MSIHPVQIRPLTVDFTVILADKPTGRKQARASLVPETRGGPLEDAVGPPEDAVGPPEKST